MASKKKKNSRRQSEAPGEEGEEIKSAKRKIIRVESEETQDYVREANDMDRQEGEETSFVPSAISFPQKPVSRRDNQRSENTLSFWQLSLVVIQEGEESYTTNFCQKCYNEQQDEPLTQWQWHEFVEKKGTSWKALENDGKRTIRTRNVEFFRQERTRVKRFREEAEEERRAGIQGQLQLESPVREYLEQVKMLQ